MLDNLIFKKREEFILKLIIGPILATESDLKLIENIGTLKENDISRALVKCLKRSNFSQIYKKGHILIQFQGEIIDEDEIKKPDFYLIHFRLFQTTDIVIEAKRIYDSSSMNEYHGTNGFQRFSSGYYDSNEFFGMLAYVQKGDFYNYISSIFDNIQFLNKKDINDKCYLTKHKFSDEFKFCFHIFLDLRK